MHVLYITASISNPVKFYWHLVCGFAARAHVSKPQYNPFHTVLHPIFVFKLECIFTSLCKPTLFSCFLLCYTADVPTAFLLYFCMCTEDETSKLKQNSCQKVKCTAEMHSVCSVCQNHIIRFIYSCVSCTASTLHSQEQSWQHYSLWQLPVPLPLPVHSTTN